MPEPARRYKLPDALGGGEYEATSHLIGDASPYDRVAFDVPGVGRVVLPTDACTPVPPPIPAEPEPGVYRAWRPGWEERGVVIVNDGEDGGNWGVVGDIVWRSWEDFVRQLGLGGPGVVIRKLQPAPEPVQLPLVITARDRDLRVRLSDTPTSKGDVRLTVIAPGREISVWLAPEDYRPIGLALLTAADAAENTRSQT